MTLTCLRYKYQAKVLPVANVRDDNYETCYCVKKFMHVNVCVSICSQVVLN